MVRTLLWLVAAAIAVWLHRPGATTGPRELRDRAQVATRLIEAEGDALATGLRAALGGPGGPDVALGAWASSNASRWPRMSVWTLRDTTWRLTRGPAVADSGRMRAWAESVDSLPPSGLVLAWEAARWTRANSWPASAPHS